MENKKSVLKIATDIGTHSSKIKRILVIMESTDGTFSADDNGISVDEAEHMVNSFAQWMRESNVKHLEEKKLSNKAKQKSYLM